MSQRSQSTGSGLRLRNIRQESPHPAAIGRMRSSISPMACCESAATAGYIANCCASLSSVTVIPWSSWSSIAAQANNGFGTPAAHAQRVWRAASARPVFRGSSSARTLRQAQQSGSCRFRLPRFKLVFDQGAGRVAGVSVASSGGCIAGVRIRTGIRRRTNRRSALQARIVARQRRHGRTGAWLTG